MYTVKSHGLVPQIVSNFWVDDNYKMYLYEVVMQVPSLFKLRLTWSCWFPVDFLGSTHSFSSFTTLSYPARINKATNRPSCPTGDWCCWQCAEYFPKPCIWRWWRSIWSDLNTEELFGWQYGHDAPKTLASAQWVFFIYR